MSESMEQKARDLLERIGVDGAQKFSAGDVVELANVLRDLAAAREQIAAHKTALQFAERAIEDAIYTEDGLEGEAGERVLHVVREAAERGTFDQTKLGELGPSMSEQIAELTAERDSARERVAKLEKGLRFYADPDSYETHRQGGPEDPVDYFHPIGEDQGAAARALLSPSPEPTK